MVLSTFYIEVARVPEETIVVPKKPRCPDCGGTGLKSHPVLKTAVCECPAGRSRGRSFDDGWD